MNSGPHSSKAPFFIVGCGRSGTTLLQTLIDGHPEIVIPPESHIYDRFGPIFHTYGDLAERRNRLRLLRAMLHDYFIRRWRLDASAEDIERRVPHNSFAGIITALFSQYAADRGAARWGDKTPGHIHHLHEIRRDFPEARLIHMVRDGRDVGEAMRRMMFYPVTALGAARVWRREVTRWLQFCETAGSDNTLVVSYESLVRAPRHVLGMVLQFIDAPYVDTTSTYAESTLSQKLAAQGPWHSSLRGEISTRKIGIYRRNFTAREIEIMEYIAGDALRENGYEPDHESPRAPTLYDRSYAFVADRVVRWYRKLYRPQVFWRDLQFRIRLAYGLLFPGPREPARSASTAAAVTPRQW